ncbi:MAG: BON domain-containing protein [Deltaproteobacteria bacterium]|nr:BON domain-containing protein [Deltaproteobacteria bacterium]
MRTSRSLIMLILVSGLVLCLWSCQTPAGRTAGQVVDDATITTKVKAKIFNDSILKGFAISVETFEGEVTLTGAVGVESERKRAEDLARATTGVRKVNNLIRIKK